MPESVMDIFRISHKNLITLLPYLLIGILISESMRFLSWKKMIASSRMHSPLLLTFYMVIIGILSPLCTYGTLPIVMNMKRDGFPLAPLIAFLTSSSLMNPQLFLLTWGAIHPPMALARLVASIAFSLMVGLILWKVPEKWILNSQFTARKADEACPSKKSFHVMDFLKRYVKTLEFIGFYVLLGILIGSMIEVLLPPGVIQFVFQSNLYVAVLTAALLGVPLYACGGGAIPMVQSLLASGMQTGAALAFFIVGPATRVTPLIALSTMLRPRFILWYVGALIAFAMLVGTIYAVPYDPLGFY